ncbi:hypothetical protein BJV78DRAFT_212824 [Lactifluus subvellereus]|nr:hypothetical protein BJV78DRAFT_212824 [Lactifluus subvellereus]
MEVYDLCFMTIMYLVSIPLPFRFTLFFFCYPFPTPPSTQSRSRFRKSWPSPDHQNAPLPLPTDDVAGGYRTTRPGMEKRVQYKLPFDTLAVYPDFLKLSRCPPTITLIDLVMIIPLMFEFSRTTSRGYSLLMLFIRYACRHARRGKI